MFRADAETPSQKHSLKVNKISHSNNHDSLPFPFNLNLPDLYICDEIPTCRHGVSVVRYATCPSISCYSVSGRGNIFSWYIQHFYETCVAVVRIFFDESAKSIKSSVTTLYYCIEELFRWKERWNWMRNPSAELDTVLSFRSNFPICWW